MHTPDDLKTIERRLQLALEASNMCIWEWNVRTDEVFWLPECFKILGVKKTTWTLGSFTDLLHPDDAARIMSAARKTVADKSVFSEEYRIIGPDGKVVWLSSLGRAEYDADGEPLRMVGIVQDITERKQEEETLQKSEERFRDLFDLAPYPVVITGLDDGIPLNLNARAEQVFGISRRNVQGKRAQDFYINPDDRPAFISALGNKGHIENYEVWLKDIQGRKFLAMMSAATIRYENVPALIVAFNDITQRKWAEEMVRKYSRELEETNSALKILLRQRERDRKALEENVMANMKQLVLPYIEMLKIRRRGNAEDTISLKIIESNLNEIVSSFSSQLSHKLTALTSKEILVADLVKDGKSDKDIAETLHLSIDTVKAHRRNIRKKLGLTGEKTNLRTFLSSLEQ